MFFMFDDKKNDKLPDESCAEKAKGSDLSSDFNTPTPDIAESWSFLSRETAKDNEVTGKKSKSRLVNLWNGLKFPRLATEIPQTNKQTKHVDVKQGSSREFSRYSAIKRDTERYTSKPRLNSLKCRSKDEWSETALSTGNRTEEIYSVNSNPFLENSYDYKVKSCADKSDLIHKSRDGPQELRYKGFKGTKDGKCEDTSLAQTLDQNGTKIECFDTRWRSLYLINDKELELIPCPTCGRKFSEEAAFRHFPICSRVKQKSSSKGSSLRAKKNKTKRKINSPNNPNHMSDESGEGNKKNNVMSKKSSKPIVYTFQKAGLRIQAKLSEGKPQSQSSEQFAENIEKKKSEKKSHLKCEGKDYKGGTQCPSCGSLWQNKVASLQCPKVKKHQLLKDANQTANGTMKSASIWKKSTKEFGKSTTKTRISKSKTKGGTSDSVESTCSIAQETPVWDDLSTGTKGLNQVTGQPYGLLFHNSNDKNNLTNVKTKNQEPKKLAPFNSRSGSKAMAKSHRRNTSNDLDAIPESFRISLESSQNLLKGSPKRHEKINTEMPTEKFECCHICGEYFRGNVSTNHIALCERIKKIEQSVSEPTKVVPVIINEERTVDDNQPTDASRISPYSLSKHIADAATDECLTTITTFECPWCQRLLDLNKT